MFSRQQASIVMGVLSAYENASRWPPVRDELLAMGYEPKEIVDAWSELADLAGQRGIHPSESDFQP